MDNTNNLLSTESTITSSEQQNSATTHFSAEDSAVLTDYNKIPQTIGLLPIKDQTISDFLAKPQYIADTAWNVSATTNTTLFSFNVATILTTADIFSQKIKGFRFVRGTAVFRLVLNAEPFHAGKLLVHFIPCYKHLVQVAWRLKTIANKTQCPNVQIDCRETECIIKMPYITPTDYYDIVDGTFDWGAVFVSVLSPLRTGTGSDTVYFSTFMHFEDFELAGPMVPQSSNGAMSKSKDRPSKSMPVSRVETESLYRAGTVSKALNAAASVAADFAEVPYLAAVAAPASWMLRGAGGLASWFGWSKPVIDSPNQIVTRRFVPNMANSTGASAASMLALYHDNAVQIDQSMGAAGLDEMSFNHMKKIKGFNASFIMTDTMLANTSLYQKFVGPKFLGQNATSTGATTSTTYNVHPPASYVAHYFKYWRGGVVMHLKFVKTDYHSGRIMVTYTPGFGATAPVALSDTSYSLREIIDIRENSDVILEIPYLENRPYLDFNSWCGLIDIRVLNELKAPSTVSSAIEVLVYFSFCDDFEVAVPGSMSAVNSGVNRAAAPFFPQSGIITNNAVGGYVCPAPTMSHSQACIGEMFTSIKQLLNRYTNVITSEPIALGGSMMQISPTVVGATRATAGTGVYVQDAIYGDALSAFACGYAFMKGSVKIMLNKPLSSQPTTAPISFTYEAIDSEDVASTILDAKFASQISSGDPKVLNLGSFTPMQLGDANTFHEIQVPYYNEYKCNLIDYSQTISMLPSRVFAPTRPRTVLAMGFLGGTGTVEVKRACGEDFQLAYFLGFPPIATSSSLL